MHPYEPTRPPEQPGHSGHRRRHAAPPSGIPGMRPSYDRPAASATPIYDSLCNEYRRLFRALPGDRSGEEDLRFRAFATGYGPGAGGSGFRELGRHRPEVAAAVYAAVALPPPAHGSHGHHGQQGVDDRHTAVRGR
ncbi:hypothetical protein [Streptomyces sp. URMC 129]|uniref:hypothetical protein n=1 Tax=Streptomyces sp. URMC 129 TaxID=3423407 RepID=UPI003F1A599E